MITVTGASGTAQLKLLTSHGVVARDGAPSRPRRRHSIAHIEIVQGDFDRPETLRAAL